MAFGGACWHSGRAVVKTRRRSVVICAAIALSAGGIRAWLCPMSSVFWLAGCRLCEDQGYRRRRQAGRNTCTEHVVELQS